jgi:ABC-type arginine transport system permease subunit
MSKVRGGQVFVEIGADSKRFFKALSDVQKGIGKIGSSMRALGSRMAAIGAGIALPVGLAVRQFAAFDDAIRATAAVSQASGTELQKLNDKARELGATTSFTAIQVANLMTELGRAGFKPDEINNMTAAVLDLARATGTDAALSAGIMAATLRQFGMGATEATRAADVLTETANATFTSVEGLGESLKYAGPVAKSLGLSRLVIVFDILLPQAIRSSLPPWLNTSIVMIKSTSYAAIVGAWELTFAARETVERTLATFEIFGAVMLFYFVICWPLSPPGSA